ncbi:hypothetical protein KKF34_15925 [Myxococcota bacterium]|nr:hypothetical protein [Myxococcota bacterium]MBU1380433.1 hypothetical protein [Myxococcota bacterium]MBU1498365.1 hypothetical protein [Myxococcota bacterium]
MNKTVFFLLSIVITFLYGCSVSIEPLQKMNLFRSNLSLSESESILVPQNDSSFKVQGRIRPIGINNKKDSSSSSSGGSSGDNVTVETFKFMSLLLGLTLLCAGLVIGAAASSAKSTPGNSPPPATYSLINF